MTRCLELLHMELFSPSAIRSYGGNRYTLVTVDDYSRYTWTRFLKDKIKAFDQFEIFSKKIQNQLGCTIVSIRTDDDKEFDNEVQFGGFCNASGYFQNSKAYIILNKQIKKIKESLNVTFDETPPSYKASPLMDDDLYEEEAIKVIEKKNLEKDIEGKENGVNILKSIDEGPYRIGTVKETLVESTEGAPQFGLERPQEYSDLTPEEKDRYNTDIRATNILLQGLPKDIYTLINHYTIAKDIWDNLNSKFVNNMLPEWGRFVMAVKLNRGMRDSNYDQLYAYLKQHKTHAKENKMMLERFSQPTVDHLALLSNVSNPQHYSPSSSASSSTHRKQNRGQVMNPRGGNAAGYGGVQTRVGNVNPGQARPVKCYNCNGTGHITWNYTQPKRSQNSKYYKDKMLLMQAQENGVALDAEQLLFLVGGQDNAFDDDVDEQHVQDLALNVNNVFQADDYDAFNSDVDEAPTAQTMFMANLSSADPITDKAGPSYDSEILSEVHDHDNY
nr:retrovirus-related Pol polyprotein from transposon TNT 1-94 [Tanacetum cinerariifolium]